jgi:hypothetical protein
MLYTRTLHKRNGSAKIFPFTFLQILYKKIAKSLFAFRVVDESNHVRPMCLL